MISPIDAQRDKRWATKKLGASNLTIGDVGCATCVVSNGLRYWGIQLTPDQIAADPNNYTKPGNPQGAGLIIWDNLVLPGGFKKIGRLFGRDDAAIMAALANPDRFIGLQVDYGRHWVLALHKLVTSNDYAVDDSWYGVTNTAIGTWHNITGAIIIGKK